MGKIGSNTPLVMPDAAFSLIDLHVDSIIQQRLFRYQIRQRHRAGLRGQPLFWHADIPRMREAGYSGACMGIHYWPSESERGWRELNRQIDYLDRTASEDPTCIRVYTPADWRHARSLGRLGLAPGVEGAHMLNGRLERVAELARRGVAYLTLAHFSRNAAATPSIGWGANESDGLTELGRALVHELNRYGIVIDVAHLNTLGVQHVCRETKAPIMCTHTGVKGVHNSRRNVSDVEIDAIAERDGTIGIMFAPFFLSGKLRAKTSIVLDHIEYIIRRVGVRHVALGSDYDGWIPTIPSDQRDCRDIVRVTEGLRQRGYTDGELALILRNNVLRVFEAAWASRDPDLRPDTDPRARQMDRRP